MSLAPLDIQAALDAMPAGDRAEHDAEAEAAGLTPELALVAKRLGMTPERYAAFAAVSSVDGAVQVRQRFADREAARKEARRQLLVEEERRALEGAGS